MKYTCYTYISGCIHCMLVYIVLLTHWGRETHIRVGKLTIIASCNGLSPGRRQAIIWTNAGILLIGPLGTNFNEILIDIHTFSFKKMHLKMSSAKWRPFCLGLNVLTTQWYMNIHCKFTITCHDWTRISLMLPASGWFWSSYGTLLHVYRVTHMFMSPNMAMLFILRVRSIPGDTANRIYWAWMHK